MLVISRDQQRFHDDEFRNFAQYIRPGDCLVLNDTRVFPARLHGKRTNTGAAIEVFLIRPLNQEETEWQVLVRPGKRVHIGDQLLFPEDLTAEVLARGDFGERTLRFHSPRRFADVLETIGETPLPPYIHRTATTLDQNRYQTVFAQHKGSVAAPTAGLHFTPEMLKQCQEAGAEIAHVTLHVGLGTFAPLREKELTDIHLHKERFAISEANAAVLSRARRLFCIGTTSVRAIETALLRGDLHATSGETDLFIYPGFSFGGVQAMLTNFHLPQSSLLMLVCAFAGRELTLAAYNHAVAERYRFFSYGDCMLIL